MPQRLRYCARGLAIASLLIMLHPNAGMAIDAEKRGDIVALFKEMGTFTNMDRMIEIIVPTIMGNLQKINPKIPQ